MGGAARGAFSLAEMMIALVILGFGLLVVGAALPIGYRYTQETVDRTMGDATVAYALDLIEQNVRLCADPWDDLKPPQTALRYYADVFEPRYGPDDPPDPNRPQLRGTVAPDLFEPATRSWEPIVKVRPLLSWSVDATPGAPTRGSSVNYQNVVDERIARWLDAVNVNPPQYREFDPFSPSDFSWLAPALPSIAAVYPPISDIQQFNVKVFLDPNTRYRPTPVQQLEGLKALGRRLTWVAFYRRVSYAAGSDPRLYEVVVVATRLPTEAYRFPILNPSVPFVFLQAGGDGASAGYLNQDTLAPIPWLVAFKDLRPASTTATYNLNDPERTPLPGFVDPPTLGFLAGPETGALFVPGSIFIPAVNDVRPCALPNQNYLKPVQWAGFVPHAPQSLPVYEVERTEPVYAGPGSDVVIIVKNNGYYPWTNPAIGSGSAGLYWPVWVIPPAIKELDGSGRPVYEKRSPIVAIGRRQIRFHQIP